MQNEQYANSYRQEAKKIKNKKIWKNFGIGMSLGSTVGGIALIGLIGPY